MANNLVLIDNNDSFTYNLVELLRQLSCDFVVIKVGDLQLDDVAEFSHFIISPGPDVPRAYPKIYTILSQYYRSKAILGICLGHQIIGEFFGATTYNLATPRHGMTGKITLTPYYTSPIFAHLAPSFAVGLYHSWAIGRHNFPECLRITATCQDGVIMAIEHVSLPIFGVQFHPESYISAFGEQIIRNFVRL
ncbi:anthranilate synthase component II [Faucicola atlantae]|uniref:Anthranilate synthase component 2 n=1 Tax=Faucicola atlantae TaxID=34059 RepID=A0A1B8QLN2_9GAMM|nr:anthranilate synthase component II [Moraxella atlantae]OBX84673.1 anthranilate synthase component 2 [Moraxella atlantae]